MKGMVERGGYIPNASSRIYADRGQIPEFADVIELLAEHEGPQVLEEFRGALEREYEWWTSGDPDEAARNPAGSDSNVVRMPDGSVLNRYATISRRPRLEAFKEDVDFAMIAAQGLTGEAHRKRMEEYNFHVRAGAAEAHDFHPGMTKDGVSMPEIEVGKRAQVALNAKLVKPELLLMQAYQQRGDHDAAEKYRQAAQARVDGINSNFWDSESRTYRDRNFITGEFAEPDATMTYPLEVGISSKDQGQGVVDAMQDYLQPGGFVFTLNPADNFNWRRRSAWPFTAKHVIRGLARAGFEQGVEGAADLAETGKMRFLMGGAVAYEQMGMTPEKIDAYDPTTLASGGEYEVVPAFAPMAEVLLYLSMFDSRRPMKGPVPLTRNLARRTLRLAA
jgi:alpha,alpha-trehalase